MVNVLIWAGWSVSVFIIWVSLIQKWHDFKNGVIKKSPEFRTFLGTEYILIGSALLRIYADDRPLFKKLTPNGFMGTGYTQAQLLLIAAWFLACLYTMKWAFIFWTNGFNRWMRVGYCVAVILLGTAGFLHLVLDMPLYPTP